VIAVAGSAGFLVVLCATPVRRGLLGTRRRGINTGGGAAGSFGSYKLLAFSNGFTGNIGYHHITPFEFADSELQFLSRCAQRLI